MRGRGERSGADTHLIPRPAEEEEHHGEAAGGRGRGGHPDVEVEAVLVHVREDRERVAGLRARVVVPGRRPHSGPRRHRHGRAPPQVADGRLREGHAQVDLGRVRVVHEALQRAGRRVHDRRRRSFDGTHQRVEGGGARREGREGQRSPGEREHRSAVETSERHRGWRRRRRRRREARAKSGARATANPKVARNAPPHSHHPRRRPWTRPRSPSSRSVRAMQRACAALAVAAGDARGRGGVRSAARATGVLLFPRHSSPRRLTCAADAHARVTSSFCGSLGGSWGALAWRRVAGGLLGASTLGDRAAEATRDRARGHAARPAPLRHCAGVRPRRSDAPGGAAVVRGGRDGAAFRPHGLRPPPPVPPLPAWHGDHHVRRHHQGHGLHRPPPRPPPDRHRPRP